ncbi:MAG: hypothetical protein IT456_08235 [Planctomycetes bacterium]|nr:hypothetical protein [Planctomycetota bacterium]
MTTTLADLFWQNDRDLAAACLAHPFVRGLADGSLPQPRYRDYVAQDAFFLRASCGPRRFPTSSSSSLPIPSGPGIADPPGCQPIPFPLLSC